ncbi:MAG TPA: retropepsin-like aspartic protease [Dysgonomonas sp.]|uniref:retropepsin-like aspartic protease n=1 Tax=unclassified Dysgonomonas TaxID=2630389 RepID=UPI0025C55600|nr:MULTISPECIES: retropepsin-like aspartic protease [unclassified Dysgonomonas]HML66200.1 retropepsin-like aspartic protease [Dysgonomonas sp.]
MKKTVLTFLIVSIHAVCFSQTTDEQAINCLSTSDFFLLEEIYPKIEDKIQTPYLKNLAESVLYTAFNQPDSAIESIDSLIANYQGEIGLENVRNMFIFQCRILLRKGEYREAYERMKGFIDQIEPHAPPEFLVASKENLKMYQALLDEDKPRLIRPDADCVVPIEIDTIKIKENEDDTIRHSTLMYAPVVVNGVRERFIFDTGCGGGVFLSQEYATRLGVRIKMDSLLISGAGGKSYGQMGIVDSIMVGNMTFRNVTATIVPPNAEVDSLFKVNAVLGNDIMDYAGEVQIFPEDRKIVFPVNKTPLPATGRNMMRVLGGDAFFLKVYSGDNRLVMLFDTGDTYAHLNGHYLGSNKEFVMRNGTKSSRVSGGFGGAGLREYYNLPFFSIKIGNKQFKIENMTVESELPIGTQFESGALGMAFINAFRKTTINFEQMFVEVYD